MFKYAILRWVAPANCSILDPASAGLVSALWQQDMFITVTVIFSPPKCLTIAYFNHYLPKWEFFLLRWMVASVSNPFLAWTKPYRRIHTESHPLPPTMTQTALSLLVVQHHHRGYSHSIRKKETPTLRCTLQRGEGKKEWATISVFCRSAALDESCCIRHHLF